MTKVEFSYKDYEITREWLNKTIKKRQTNEERKFFLSFEAGEPDWELFPLPVLKDLPAVKWKLINLIKLKEGNPKKYKQMLNKLKSVFD